MTKVDILLFISRQVAYSRRNDGGRGRSFEAEMAANAFYS
jgi:hypothetical protein